MLYRILISSQCNGTISLLIWIYHVNKNSVYPDQQASSESSLIANKGIDFEYIYVHDVLDRLNRVIKTICVYYDKYSIYTLKALYSLK